MKDSDRRKPWIFYFTIVMVIMILMNAYVLPSLMSRMTKEVDYGTFLKHLESNKIDKVKVHDTKIAYIILNDNGEEEIYVTGRMEDPDLVNRLHEAGIEFESIIPQETSPIIDFIMYWVLPGVMFYALGRFMLKRLSGKLGSGNAMTFGKSNAKVYVEAQTGKSFSDVAGQDEAKENLQEVVDFLHDPRKYNDIGATIPKGVLLVGPPGTGKTLLAKAVAGESKVPFFSISGSEFVEMFVGMGAARVRDLFKQAQDKAPCIVFIDEIDTIGKSRNTAYGGNDEREQTLNQLLTEMDGFNSNKGLVILAATNRPESLDKALLRPGRFDRIVRVELPDIKGREEILKVHAKKIKLGDNIDLRAIARATPGSSGADLANIVNEAALRAVRLGRKYVIQNDLEESVEVVIAGHQKKNSVISEDEKKVISYHEVGHALVAAKQKHSAPVHKITIIPRTSGALGYTLQIDEDEKVLLTKEEILDKITIYVGGRVAEELVFNTMTSGAANDIEQATKLARAMITRYGMSDTFGMMALETVNNPYLGDDASLLVSSRTAAKIDEEIMNTIKEAYNRATKILSDNIDKLHEISKYLLEKETITGEEFLSILNRE